MTDTRYTKQYVCTKCKRDVLDRDRLTVKKASFHNMGSKARTIRSRVVHWLCPDCLKADPDWNRQAYSDPTETDTATVGTS